MSALKIASGIFVALILYMVVKNNIAPSNIGVNNGKLAELGSKPNGVSTQTSKSEKFVEPLKFIGNLKESKEKVKEAVNNYGGAKIIKESDDYIYYVFTTGTMRYKDDVEFWFDEENKLIHFRSESRVGYSDMGLNKKRFDEIKRNLQR